jgi:hypothetical protein
MDQSSRRYMRLLRLPRLSNPGIDPFKTPVDLRVGKKAGCASYSAASGLTAFDGRAGFSGPLPLVRTCAPCISTPTRMTRMATMTVRAPIEPSSERSVQRHAGGKMPPLLGANRGKSQWLREDRFDGDGRLLRSDSSRFLRLLRLSLRSNSGIARLESAPRALGALVGRYRLYRFSCRHAAGILSAARQVEITPILTGCINYPNGTP